MRNRTSTVSPERSIGRIEKRLSSMGATEIVKRFSTAEGIGEGVTYVSSLVFHVPLGDKLIGYKLPAKVESIFAALEPKRRETPAVRRKRFEQAGRTAWKLIWEWVDIQATMIEMKQAEAAEVFMPYMIVDKSGTSFYEAAVETGRYGPKLLEG